jgi:release factor glutamine methyltransferase
MMEAPDVNAALQALFGIGLTEATIGCRALSLEEVRKFLGVAALRAAGLPLQRVLGRWWFAGLEVRTDWRALIPRPETESVLEAGLEFLSELEPPYLVADLGTGSGVLAVAFARRLSRSSVRVVATDRSEEALELARDNARDLGVEGLVSWYQGNWYHALPGELRGCLDLVVSNPPYVAEAEYEGLPDEVRLFEPREALVAGPTGLEAIEEVLSGAREYCAERGAVVVEVAPHQAERVARTAEGLGFAWVAVRQDVAGRPRVVVCKL